MVIALALALALAKACAPAVAPETLLSVARVESDFDPLVIGVNGHPRQVLHPDSPAQAGRLARALATQGRSVDLGLVQINARNLQRLGLTFEQAFDPCRNLAGGARILAENYLAAARRSPKTQDALEGALSAYNTGDAIRGLRNGYVARVYQAGLEVVPALHARVTSPSPGPPNSDAPPPSDDTPAPEPPPLPNLDVFARTSPASLVWNAPSLVTSRRPAPSKPGDPS